MAIINKASDAANTAVRAYLTKKSRLYIDYDFNSSKKGKVIWSKIRDEEFEKNVLIVIKRKNFKWNI